MGIDFAEARRKMVDCQLRTTDITSVAVLDAMGEVPRELFVPPGRSALAYIDEDLEIAPAESGSPARYLMEPSPFGLMVQAAAIRPTEAVLIVGGGSGYSAAVLSRLAGSVVCVESNQALADAARAPLARLGCGNVNVVVAALESGHPAGAPYDVVLIEGAIGHVPDALLDQLRDGGRLVAIEGRGNSGVGRLYIKENGAASARRLFNAAVKPLPGFTTEAAFVF